MLFLLLRLYIVAGSQFNVFSISSYKLVNKTNHVVLTEHVRVNQIKAPRLMLPGVINDVIYEMQTFFILIFTSFIFYSDCFFFIREKERENKLPVFLS